MNSSESPTLTPEGVLIRDSTVLFLNTGHDDVHFPPIGGQIFTFNKSTYTKFVETTTIKSPSQTPQLPDPTQLSPTQQHPSSSSLRRPNPNPNSNSNSNSNPFLTANASPILNANSQSYIPTCNASLFPKHLPLDKIATLNHPTANQQIPDSPSTFSAHPQILSAISLLQQVNPDYDPAQPYHPVSRPSLPQLQHMFSPPQRAIVEAVQRCPSSPADASQRGSPIPTPLLEAAKHFDLNRFLIYPTFTHRWNRDLTFHKFNPSNRPQHQSQQLQPSPSPPKQIKTDITPEMKKYLAESCYHHLLSSMGSYFETPFINPELLSHKSGYNHHTANPYNSFNHLPGLPIDSGYHATIEDIIYPTINKDIHNIVSIAFQDDLNEITEHRSNQDQSPSQSGHSDHNSINHTELSLNLHNYWFNQPNSPTTLHTMTEFNPVYTSLPSSSHSLSPPQLSPHDLPPLLHNTEINQITLPLVPCSRFFPPVHNPDDLYNLIPRSVLTMKGKLYSNLLNTTFIQPYFTEQLQGYAAYGQSPTLPFLAIPMDLTVPNEKQTNFVQKAIVNNDTLFKLQATSLLYSLWSIHSANNTLDPLKVSQAKQRLQVTPPIETDLRYQLTDVTSPNPNNHSHDDEKGVEGYSRHQFQPISLSPYHTKRLQDRMPFWYPYSSYIYTFCDTAPQVPAHDTAAIDHLHAIAASRVFDFDTLPLPIQSQVRDTPLGRELDAKLAAKAQAAKAKREEQLKNGDVGFSGPSFFNIIKNMFSF